MNTMNARLIPILMIAIMLMGSVRPFSQNVLNPSTDTLNDNSENQAIESADATPNQGDTGKKPADSSDEDSDTSHPLTQGEMISAVMVEMSGRTLRLFPVSRMVKSSINRPVIVWSLAHSMDVRLSRVVALERCATFSLSVVAPPIQSHAPPTRA